MRKNALFNGLRISSPYNQGDGLDELMGHVCLSLFIIFSMNNFPQWILTTDEFHALLIAFYFIGFHIFRCSAQAWSLPWFLSEAYVI